MGANPSRPWPLWKDRGFLIAAALMLAVSPLRAQLGRAPGEVPAVKATTTLHPDGRRTTSVFNPDTSTIEATTYDAADKILGRVVYDVDPSGVVTGGKFHSGQGRFLYRTTYLRDPAGHVLEESRFDASDRLTVRQIFDYKADGKLLSIKVVDAQGKLLSESKGGGPAKRPAPTATPRRGRR